MLKTFFECASEIESQAIETDRVRAVLSEATEYFNTTDDQRVLAYYADHIMKLLHVVEIHLADIQAKLSDTAKTMYDTSKATRKLIQEVSA